MTDYLRPGQRLRSVRTGRKVGRTLYIQLGKEPADSDPIVGLVDTPELAALICKAVNAQLDDRPMDPNPTVRTLIDGVAEDGTEVTLLELFCVSGHPVFAERFVVTANGVRLRVLEATRKRDGGTTDVTAMDELDRRFAIHWPSPFNEGREPSTINSMPIRPRPG